MIDCLLSTNSSSCHSHTILSNNTCDDVCVGCGSLFVATSCLWVRFCFPGLLTVLLMVEISSFGCTGISSLNEGATPLVVPSCSLAWYILLSPDAPRFAHGHNFCGLLRDYGLSRVRTSLEFRI
jgi:hypothetical protein